MQTLDCDVCVVGLGLAGVSALREATEQGAKVIGIEKGTDLGYRSGEFGAFGSELIHKKLGIPQPATQEAVNELMKVMGNRPNALLLNHWIANSGADIDWYISTVDFELLPNDHSNPVGDKEMIVLPERFPINPNYDWRTENYPCFPGMVHLLPDHGPALRAGFAQAQAAGAQAFFNTKGEQLIKEGDRVVGIYATGEDGGLLRINASKGVILTCGDMSSDREMLEYYCPQALSYGPYFSTMDAQGQPVNTGDGQKMALWAGAVMEEGPYAPMTHSLGTNSIGIDPFLMVNVNGVRFANEDVGAQELQNQIKRQPGGNTWQIFDAKWPEQLEFMPQCFGGVSHFVPAEQEAEYDHIINHFAGGYASKSYFQGEIEAGSIIEAASIEELAEKTGIPAAALQTTIARYNELAAAGVDEDFCKVSSRLFAVDTAPFYAVNFGDSGMLVVIGGIDVDEKLRALDPDKVVIPGLYVAGNTQGGRFLVDYPVTVAGASHSMALAFGRLAGRMAAEQA
jgi:succinate dehydrogenase/fumarate reductase flavoprotein subunit